MSLETSILIALNNIPQDTARYVFYLSDSVYALSGIAIFYAILKRKIPGGIRAGITLLIVYLANTAIKISVGEQRPLFSGLGIYPFDAETTLSFPSTHSAIAFAGAGLIGSPLAYLWAAAISVSRVVLGAHYPHDVVAGAIIGYVLSKSLSSRKLDLLFSGKNIFETRRKLFHAFFGALVAFVIYFFGKKAAIFLMFALAVSLAFSHMLKKTGTIPWLSWFVEKLERKKDLENWPLRGSIFFILGALLTTLVFEREIAFASVLILAAGDGASTLIGKPLGRHKHIHNRKKSVEGTIAGLFASYVAASFFIPLNPAIFGATVFAIVESFDFQKSAWIDDNLVVPLAVGAAMSFIWIM